MKQLNAIAIRLSLFIIAAVSIAAACSMNCNCCSAEKTKTAETAVCCAVQISPVPQLLSTIDQTTQNTCSSCTCNTIPQKESNAISTRDLTPKMHLSAISILKQPYLYQHTFSNKTYSVSLNTYSAHVTPLRI